MSLQMYWFLKHLLSACYVPGTVLDVTGKTNGNIICNIVCCTLRNEIILSPAIPGDGKKMNI